MKKSALLLFIVAGYVYESCAYHEKAEKFFQAINTGNTSEFNKILASHPDVIKARDSMKGTTPLHAAAARGNLPFIEALLKHGAHTEAEDGTGQTPIFYAQDQNVQNFLMQEGGASITLPFSNEREEFNHALENNNLDTLKRLIEVNPEFVHTRDKKGMTALHKAAAHGKLDLVKALLGKGADIDAEDIGGLTPIFHAQNNQQDAVMQYLMNQGAAISFAPDVEVRKLTDVFDVIKKGGLEHVQALLDRKPDLVNAKDEKSRTPLHIAAYRGDFDLVKQLVARGADIEVEDTDGITALFYVDPNHPELQDFFVKQGARIYLPKYPDY